jgi:hypothetical protein
MVEQLEPCFPLVLLLHLNVLLKTHQILHPLATFESMANRARDEDLNLDIFEITSKTNELSKKFVR